MLMAIFIIYFLQLLKDTYKMTKALIGTFSNIHQCSKQKSKYFYF